MAPATVEPTAELLVSTSIAKLPCRLAPAAPSDRLPPAASGLGMIKDYGKWAINRMEAEMTQQAAVRHKRGGLYFEDFVTGDVIEHRYTRTVTQMDNMLFSNMTLNPQPLHIDRHFCEQE